MMTLGLKHAFRRFNQTMRKLRHPEIRATPCSPELGDSDDPCAVQILYDCNYHKPDQGMSERSDFETQDEAEVFLHGWCCGLDFDKSPRSYLGRPVVEDCECPKCKGIVVINKTTRELMCLDEHCGTYWSTPTFHYIAPPKTLCDAKTAGEVLEHQYGEDFSEDFTVEEDEDEEGEINKCRYCGLDCDESGVCDRCYKEEMKR
jgi:hypothetical protein